MLFRYQERLHLSYAEAIATPWPEIEKAYFIWGLDDQRVKLEEEERRFNSSA